MKWSIESFTPSDGSKVQFVIADHQAWLKGEDNGGRIHISLNISSNGVSENAAKMILDAMISGLNNNCS